MGIFSKLTTLARGAARESAEVILDANAIRVFEQEIVDVEESIQLRKQAMSEVIVARNQIDREIESIKSIISKREDQARTMIVEGSDGDLIDEIASDIVQYEETHDELQAQHKAMTKRILTMETALRRALTEIVQYRRDLRLARAQQIGASNLARANNIPKQLSELEGTRRHIAALQTGDDDRESAWEEMEDRMDPQGLNQRHNKISQAEQAKKKEAVLRRLNNAAKA
jgi:phage shock protein A